MNRPLAPRALLFQAVVLLALAASSDSPADSTYYRRAVADRFPERKYVEELPARSGGTYYRVERDSAGRITRETRYRNGEPAGDESINLFDGNGKLPSGSRYFHEGAEKRRTKYTRDASGNISRIESYTVDGTLTGYSTAEYPRNDLIVTHAFTPGGKEINRTDTYYSPAGILVRSREYDVTDLSRYLERTYDVATGRVISTTQLKGDKVELRRKYAFNPDGDVVREDAYEADGSLWASEEFSDNLPIKRRYGDGRELRFAWDAHRVLMGTEVWFDGRLICRLTYDRLPDYTVTRTIAVGPNGDLWAEYPNREVIDVFRNGMPLSGGTAKILKKGNWW